MEETIECLVIFNFIKPKVSLAANFYVTLLNFQVQSE